MIDINITQLSSDNRATFMPQPNSVSGIKLLAQKVSIILLTKMSEVLRSGEGSTFIGSIGTASNTPEYVSLLLFGALDDVQRIMGQDKTSPDNERLGSLSTEAVSVSGDAVSFTLRVVSVSGESTEITSAIGG